MIANWMIYAVVLGLAVSALAAAGEYALRLYGRSTRWLWATSLVTMLVVPVLAWCLTPVPAKVVFSPDFQVQPMTVGELMPVPPPPPPPPVPAAVPLQQRLVALEARFDGALPWLWLAGSVLAALALALSYLRLRGQRSQWAESEVDGVPVLVSETAGPAVVGLRRSRIVVPSWVLEEPEGRRRMILAHEAEHIAAGDARLVTGALAALVLAPWNPAAWWQVRRLRLAAELDCDARVLRRGADLRGYAGLLLDVGMRFGDGAAVAAFAEPRSLLARRLRTLTAPLPRRRGWRVAAGALGAVAVTGAAWIAPRPARPAQVADGSGAAPVAASSVGAPMPFAQDTPNVPPRGTGAEAEIRTSPPPAAQRDTPITAYDVAPKLLNQAEVSAAVQRLSTPAMRTGGTVRLHLHIDETGRVTSTLLDSPGNAAADSAGLQIARIMRFAPATRGGKAVAAWIDIPGPTREPRRAEILGGPIFTPYTVAPELTNRDEVRQALMREYPPQLKAAGVGGTTLIWLLIDEQGRAVRSSVKKTSEKVELDSASVRVGRMMRFKPGLNRDKPVMVWVALPIIFKTTADGEAARPTTRYDYTGLPKPDSKYGVPGLPEGLRPPNPGVNAGIVDTYSRAYPRDAKVSGPAWVSVTVSAEGNAGGFKLARSSGDARVDSLALDFARKLHWEPAVDSERRAHTTTVAIPFPPPLPPRELRPPGADTARSAGLQQRLTLEQLRERPSFTPYDVAPELTNREEVRRGLVREYPPDLKASGVGGTVQVWMLLNHQGGVEKVAVRKTSGTAQLDTAAVRVARDMTFSPGQFRGTPVDVWIALPIIFKPTLEGPPRDTVASR